MDSELIISLFDSIPLWVMLTPIIVCSIIAFAVILERTIFFRKINHDYRMIIANVINMIKENRMSEVQAVCKNYESPIIDLIEGIVNKIGSGESKERVILELSSLAVRRIEKYIGVISTIATIAPMLGLFGTVTGMMKSFSGLAKVGQAAHDLLALGIAEALITTAFGLLVAIPSLIFYNYMVSKADYYIKNIELVANSLAEI